MPDESEEIEAAAPLSAPRALIATWVLGSGLFWVALVWRVLSWLVT